MNSQHLGMNDPILYKKSMAIEQFMNYSFHTQLMNHPFLSEEYPIKWSALTADHIEPDLLHALDLAEQNLQKIVRMTRRSQRTAGVRGRQEWSQRTAGVENNTGDKQIQTQTQWKMKTRASLRPKQAQTQA